MESMPPRDLGEIMRDEMVMRGKITDLLKDGPKTIPEIAESLGKPAYEAQLWIMAMWRYGKVAPSSKADTDGYYKYGLVPQGI